MTDKRQMLKSNTPVEDYRRDLGLVVKREDQACLSPGPQFSKTRGVWARVASRPENTIGVLDTYHSQAGHAVARACQLLGKRCVNYYPVFKAELGGGPLHLAPVRASQGRATELGAVLRPLAAGRSAILYHQAKKRLSEEFGPLGVYMMPNALKLEESVSETAEEMRWTRSTRFWNLVKAGNPVIVPCSSGTIAAGVVRGLGARLKHFKVLLHMGYDRSTDELLRYVRATSGTDHGDLVVVNEGYGYKDKSRTIVQLPFPCNHYYDMKAVTWWLREGRTLYGEAVLWNIG